MTMNEALKTALERVVNMGQSDLASDIRELLSLLDDDDWQMRRAASQAVTTRLGNPDHKDHHALIFAALISAVIDKSRAGCRAAAIAALETIGKPALPFLATAIRTASAGGQVALAGVVGSAGGAFAVEILKPLAIQDSNTNVSAAALTALGKTNSPAAFGILAAALESTDDWLTFSVVGALGDLGDERGIPLLEPLLDNIMLEEAATLALVQIRTVEAAQVLVKHCYSESGSLRETVLMALAALYRESGLTPRELTDRLRRSIRLGFRAVANGDMLSVLAEKTASQNSELARSALLALGWLGQIEAIRIIAEFLSDPALTRASRIGLSDLVAIKEPLQAIMKGARFDIPLNEIALALVPHHSVSGIEAAVEIMLTEGDPETSESARYALSSAREWISKPGSIASDSKDLTGLSEVLLEKLFRANGPHLVEIAMTLAALPVVAPFEFCERALRSLSGSEVPENVIARLYLLERVDRKLAIREAQTAQRHSDAGVRLCAVELISRNVSLADGLSLIQHSTDESTAVRRAAIRAIGRTEPSVEVLRMLRAGLSDNDVWVRADAIMSLGALFAGSPDVLPDLKDSLANVHPLCRLAAVRALVDYISALRLSEQCGQIESNDVSTIWNELLQVALKDSQAEVRRVAVMAFLACPVRKFTRRVAYAALKDENWSIQYAAVELLGKLGTPNTINLLIGLASHETVRPAVRGAAIRALAEQGNASACELASAALNSGDETLIEDGFNSLRLLACHQKEALNSLTTEGPPRTASIVRYVLGAELSDPFPENVSGKQ